MCVYCSSGLNLGALEFWTVLLITDCSSSMYKTYQVGLMREGKNKPKSFITLQNGIDWFFLAIFWCPAGTHCCAVSPEGGHWDLLMPKGLSGVCLPTRAVPPPGPLQELPPHGGEVSSSPWTCRNSFPLFHMSCLSGNGTVSEVARAALLLGQFGAGLPLSCFADGFGVFSGHVHCGREVFLTYSPSFLKTMNLLLVQPRL